MLLYPFSKINRQIGKFSLGQGRNKRVIDQNKSHLLKKAYLKFRIFIKMPKMCFKKETLYVESTTHEVLHHEKRASDRLSYLINWLIG